MIDEKLLIERIKRLENNVDEIMFKDSYSLMCIDSEEIKYLFKLIIDEIKNQVVLQKSVYLHCNNCKYLRNNGTLHLKRRYGKMLSRLKKIKKNKKNV